jgi:hypothetical protein
MNYCIDLKKTINQYDIQIYVIMTDKESTFLWHYHLLIGGR